VAVRQDLLEALPTTGAIQELAARDVAGALSSSPRRLASAEATARLAAEGHNVLPAPPRRSVVRGLLTQFTDLFAVVLLVAAGITMAVPDRSPLQRQVAVCLAGPFSDGPSAPESATYASACPTNASPTAPAYTGEHGEDPPHITDWT
jgi:Cation transporter/ATPase, N-terminus